MAKQPRLLFSPEDLKVLAQQRYEHLDPRVQQQFGVLWLISQKVPNIKQPSWPVYFVSVPCVESGSVDDPGRIGPP